MIKLNAKTRKDFGKKTKVLKKTGRIPAVVYGDGVKNIPLEINYEEFKKVFDQTGESSLVALEIDGEKKERPVLIYDIQRDPVSGKFIHVDFYQASLKEEVEVMVPLVFEGVSLAVKELGGTLVKEIQEIEVKALPQNLPHDIKVDISSLKTFEDEIFIKDLKLPVGVKVLKKPDEIVALAVPAAKVEEELAKPVEEKVEDVEKVEKEKKGKEEEEMGEAVKEKPAPSSAEKKKTEKK
ncbi:50S ribosomal protein L25 [Patescibacteria group bacterium]|nr:50S ribosomal protein L25 [Patescibacteria group bacterium]MBU4274807.1 50S ribosomal protein L25 [Patescibacteria group bacterium]MBU4367777.1 50S ribosomal protein L25 [Patescibacteria group bacterium]MBU4461467.1 50S ribosomal protein L25 [Patescibacteria group bacterium]MCG2700401.1 50S ribosomal protein L25 [Candidatus Parcubacteria bacterium]